MKKILKKGFRVSRYVVYKETLLDAKEHFWSFIGSFIGIGLIALFQSNVISNNDAIFLIGSFGASSVLVYGAIQSPLAQPRNLIGGHLISALIFGSQNRSTGPRKRSEISLKPSKSEYRRVRYGGLR